MANDTNGNKWKWLVGPVITLAIVLAGFIASWATTKTAVAEIQKDVAKIEQQADELENKVHELEVKGAIDSSVLQNLQSDVAEIKSDVKKLLEPR